MTLGELKTQHAELEATRPAVAETLERIREHNATARDCHARVCAEGLRQTEKQREIKSEITSDVFHNPASDLLANAERLWSPARFIATLHGWNEQFAEIEPKLDQGERQAEISLYRRDWEISRSRVELAEAKLVEDTAVLDIENGGVQVHSNLIDSLRRDLAAASRRYHSAVDAYKELVVRHEQRRVALASHGIITSGNVSNAIGQA